MIDDDVVCVICMCYLNTKQRVAVKARYNFSSPVGGGKICQQLYKNMLPELTNCNKRSAQEQHVCHDGVLLICNDNLRVISAYFLYWKYLLFWRAIKCRWIYLQKGSTNVLYLLFLQRTFFLLLKTMNKHIYIDLVYKIEARLQAGRLELSKCSTLPKDSYLQICCSTWHLQM